jgi:CheY-like chemotaxis protein
VKIARNSVSRKAGVFKESVFDPPHPGPLPPRRGNFCANILTRNYAQASLLEWYSYAVVLLDYQMPELDGIEATTHIRTRDREKNTHPPIIAVTAHTLKRDREHCLRAGMED